VAFILSLGAPLGLLLTRGFTKGEWGWEFVLREVAGDPGTYAYVSLSTAVVFTVFAFVLGLQADWLYDVSGTDALTGLRNRRRLEERLDEDLSRAERYRTPLAILLIDIDGLKSCNDRLGHRAGDRALQTAATAIRLGSRAADLAGRWGGDEFLLIAPNTTVEEARQLGERIRGLVAAASQGGVPGTTVSVGVGATEPGEEGRAVETLIAAADAALYEAKRLGRNSVAVA